MNTKIKETKEKILEALEGIKEYEVSFAEEVVYSKIFKAKSKEELEKKFEDGELRFEGTDICDGEMIKGSLEILEWHDG